MVKIPSASGWMSAIKTKLKSITPLGVATTSVGLAGAGVALYDSHALGKLKAFDEKNTGNANAGYNYFNNTQYLDNESQTTAKLKEALFEWELMNTLRGATNATIGYVKGFSSSLINHAVPIVASVAAIGLKGKKALIGVAGLALCGAYSGIRHVCSHLDHKL